MCCWAFAYMLLNIIRWTLFREQNSPIRKKTVRGNLFNKNEIPEIGALDNSNAMKTATP